MRFSDRDKSLIVLFTTEYDGNSPITAILADPIHNEGKIIKLHFIVMEMSLDILAEAPNTCLDDAHFFRVSVKYL